MTEEPTICFICKRRAEGLAYAPTSKSPFRWLCSDPTCHALAKEVYQMPQPQLDAYERAAALKAGVDAGAYLDSIGKTDLAFLDEFEWEEFLQLIVVGFSKELRRKLLANEPPF